MIKATLGSGLRVIYEENKSDIIVIHASVLVGSNNETVRNNGISHLLEHMVFEGTVKRSSLEISREIEKFGGEINAYTSGERTSFYVKIHRKHREAALGVLADIILNPSLLQKALTKEKNVITEEINMIDDEPRQYQWILFMKSLFEGPLGFSPSGTKKSVASIKRSGLMAYHRKNYTAKNTIVTIVGDCSEWRSLVEKHFTFRKAGNRKNLKVNLINSHSVHTYQKRNIGHHYLIIGYKTPPRSVMESYALDIIAAILGKGQSGWLFDEIRTKRGLTYDLGVIHSPSCEYGFFAFYTSASAENIKEIESIYLQQVRRISTLTEDELSEAKSYIEGNFALKIEDSHTKADLISFFEECKDCKDYNEYLKKIRAISLSEVKSTAIKTLNSEYTKCSIVPKNK